MRNFVRSIVLSEPVLAEPLEDANAAYDKEDYVTALRLFRPLAEQGDTRAQFMLGGMYSSGQGVPLDYAKAVKWFRLAADQGYDEAQSRLGAMYNIGQGVPQDYAQAVKWYRLAADRGYARAQSRLGFMYSLGHGVPKDYVQAVKWFNLSAARASADEKDVRDHAAKALDELASMMTPAQVAEAQKRASAWKPK